MADEQVRLRAERITSPIQLLAACLVLIIVVETAFLGGAAAISRPAWAAGLLVICAVTYVPGILCFLFILQTRYRPELMADAEYARLRAAVSDQAAKLDTSLRHYGFDLESIVRDPGRRLTEAQARDIDQTLQAALASLPHLEQAAATPAVPSFALLQAAKALMAVGRWSEAASFLDDYISLVPDNWEVQFSRALSHANSRAGAKSDLAAFRAYNEAIALAPPDLESDMRAKLYAYRGAMAKRLGRLDEAEADLLMAESLSGEEGRQRDIDYNLAGVYAMAGRKDEAFKRLDRLRGSSWLRPVQAHSHDYFVTLRDDPRFSLLFPDG
jgi:tetratricopeptide (TPR) repeat protein